MSVESRLKARFGKQPSQIITELANQGYSRLDIAEHMGINRATLWRLGNRLKINWPVIRDEDDKRKCLRQD